MRSEYRSSVGLSINNREGFPHELDFHWFPLDQWILEMFQHRIHISRIEIPRNNAFPTKSLFIGSRSTNGFLWAIRPSIRAPRIELPLIAISNLWQIDLLYQSCSFDPVRTNERTNKLLFFRRILLSVEGIKNLSFSLFTLFRRMKINAYEIRLLNYTGWSPSSWNCSRFSVLMQWRTLFSIWIVPKIDNRLLKIQTHCCLAVHFVIILSKWCPFGLTIPAFDTTCQERSSANRRGPAIIGSYEIHCDGECLHNNSAWE